MEAAVVACMADWEASLSVRGLCRYIDVCVLRVRYEIKCVKQALSTVYHSNDSQ